MTKLMTIDVQEDKSEGDLIYIVNVIAKDQENILILKDLFDDRERNGDIHCRGVKLNHCYQHVYELLPHRCTKGQLFVKTDCNMSIENAMDTIEKTILNFIL